jgi:7,8-dihydropterin-6-yl-methyl-4-(beta-D-ribofuranosyl)aminobenzene 5'-phosphate synthase
VKIWVLMENTAREGFAAEHGLSLYIEALGYRILFDMGQTGDFAENAQKLGIDLSRVDLAVVSHGHYDHGGGLRRFLECNATAPVYLSRYAFEPHENATGKQIGLDSALADHPRLRFVEDQLEIAPGLMLFHCQPAELMLPVEPYGLTCGGEPETFRHEVYLQVREKEWSILFSGCAHKGVVNLARRFRPDVLVGGFHFKPLSPEDPALTVAAEQLLQQPAVYYTGHCTGQEQFAAMKKVMGSRLHSFCSGSILELTMEETI